MMDLQVFLVFIDIVQSKNMWVFNELHDGNFTFHLHHIIQWVFTLRGTSYNNNNNMQFTRFTTIFSLLNKQGNK